LTAFSYAMPGTRPMKVCTVAVYRGPHLYSHIPMIRVQLDLGTLEDFPTNKIEGFSARLLEAVPGLAGHGCSYGEPGGLVKRMEEGTWIGHVAEHIALELQNISGSAVSRGKTRSVNGRPGVYDVMFAYNDEEVGRFAGRLALELIHSLLPLELKGIEGLDEVYVGADYDGIAGGLVALRDMVHSRKLGPTTASLIAEAERRDIPWFRVDASSLIQLGQGSRQKRVRASCTNQTSEVGTEIASDKDLTKLMLSQAGLPTPKGELVRSAEDAVASAERLGYPVVTKPLDGNHGRGVNVGLRNEEEVRWGFAQAREHSRSVLVEQNYTGSDHRVLVIGGRVVAVAERRPAEVTGDGKRTIAELIAAINADPRRGDGHETFLTRISVDDCVERLLERCGLTLASVPTLGQQVVLRPTANISTGGTAIDRTDVIHPENVAVAERAAKVIGLDIAGIDFISPDISKPVSETGGGIIEVNAGPGFRMHLQPSVGQPRNVARPVLDLLYPGDAQSRIPIFAITGTNGKSTTARMLGHILQKSGLSVGLTSTTGVYINGRRIIEGDCSGPQSARMVLREPSVDAAVLETARGGILREGLGFEACDVGAVLNVSADHLGLRGIETVEDLAAVKSVVVEAVRRGGCSVLNADNEHTASMEKHAGGRICFFTMRAEGERPAFLEQHIATGGLTVARNGRDGAIFVYDGGSKDYLLNAAEIPATFNGWAEFNVENALAAMAMAYAHGVNLPIIREAMRGFTTSVEHSPGRLNVFDGHGFTTIVDYAHNPHGLQALGILVNKMRASHRRCIGMVGIAGDRRDMDIRQMGAIAASMFDEVVFKEDDERRGRRPGEVNNLLMEGAIAAGCSPSRIRIIEPEDEAAEMCLRIARSGDLVVLTCDHIERVWKLVTSFDPNQSPSHNPTPTVHHLRSA
jgi:cyanophycin synthetase